MMQNRIGAAENSRPGPKCSANGKLGVLEALRAYVAAFVLHQPPLVMRHAPYHLCEAPWSL
jgi:hypothetical protein